MYTGPLYLCRKEALSECILYFVCNIVHWIAVGPYIKNKEMYGGPGFLIRVMYI